MSDRTPPPPTPAPWRDGLAVAAAALLLYRLLTQEVLYGPDGPWMLVRGNAGPYTHPHHFLYLPLVWLARQVLQPLGLTIFAIEGWVSAATTAAAVLVVHRACAVLRLPRRTALLATALFAAAPAVVFYATVVELHGPFLLLAAPSFVAAAALVRAPTVPRALAVGLCTGLSVAGHATGNLLPAMLWPMLLAWRRDLRWRRALVLGAAIAAAHFAATTVLIQTLKATGFPVSAGRQWTHLMHFAAEYLPRLWLIGITLRDDWVWPFFPLAVLALVGLARADLRREAVAVHVALLPYALVTYILMGTRNERGAYMLPLAWPLAVLVAKVAQGWRGGLAAVLTVAVAVLQVVRHDDPTWARSWAAGFREVYRGDDDRAVLLVGQHREVEALFTQMPRVRFWPLSDWSEVDAGDPATLAALDLLLGQWRGDGLTVYLTEGGERFLREPWTERTGFGPLLLRHLLDEHRWQQVGEGTFAARRLEK